MCKRKEKREERRVKSEKRWMRVTQYRSAYSGTKVQKYSCTVEYNFLQFNFSSPDESKRGVHFHSITLDARPTKNGGTGRERERKKKEKENGGTKKGREKREGKTDQTIQPSQWRDKSPKLHLCSTPHG